MLSLVTADREVLDVNQTGTYSNNIQILGVLSRAPENCLHSRKKFADAERFGHIVVGSHLQTPDLVVILSFCRKHDDRSIEFLSPDFLADLIAIDVRQHQIENDAIRLFPSQELQSLFPGSRSNNIVTLKLENIPEPASHFLLVFNNQDPLHSEPVKRSVYSKFVSDARGQEPASENQAAPGSPGFPSPDMVISAESLRVPPGSVSAT